MADKVCTREEDEMLLDWLDMRDRGLDCAEIAKRYPPVRPDYVRAATNRVRRTA